MQLALGEDCMGRNKRKNVAREPSGRASRAGEPKYIAPAQIRRLRDAAINLMADRCWGTELGRLFLAHRITASQFTAGERWARLARDYAMAIDVKELQSAKLERGSLGTPPDPFSERGLKVAARERETVMDMRDAHRALLDAGKVTTDITREVCEGERSAGLFEQIYLTNGLNALASFWALTEK